MLTHIPGQVPVSKTHGDCLPHNVIVRHMNTLLLNQCSPVVLCFLYTLPSNLVVGTQVWESKLCKRSSQHIHPSQGVTRIERRRSQLLSSGLAFKSLINICLRTVAIPGYRDYPVDQAELGLIQSSSLNSSSKKIIPGPANIRLKGGWPNDYRGKN